MKTILCWIQIFIIIGGIANAFVQPQARRQQQQKSTVIMPLKNGKDDTSSSNKGFPKNPFSEFTDMFKNIDDVIEDFFYKRMGNGEVFYGQRKYKPSNRPNTQGRYNGMGLSDKTRIDVAREYREELLEKRREKQQQQRK